MRWLLAIPLLCSMAFASDVYYARPRQEGTMGRVARTRMLYRRTRGLGVAGTGPLRLRCICATFTATGGTTQYIKALRAADRRETSSPENSRPVQ